MDGSSHSSPLLSLNWVKASNLSNVPSYEARKTHNEQNTPSSKQKKAIGSTGRAFLGNQASISVITLEFDGLYTVNKTQNR